MMQIDGFWCGLLTMGKVVLIKKGQEIHGNSVVTVQFCYDHKYILKEMLLSRKTEKFRCS